VKLQGTHIELEYCHERLVESHTLLEVANEVLVNSVKSYTPHCTTSTYTQVENDISCANPWGPKGKPSWYDQVIAKSCDDFIAQENDDLMQEIEKLKKEVAKLKIKEKVQPSQDNREPMVKKLEKRIIVTRSISQQNHKINDHKIEDKMKLIISSATSAHTWDIMHPCAHSRKKTIQTNQRDKEVLLREDALVVMRKGTRLKLASTSQGVP
jgi:hypothetical protein